MIKNLIIIIMIHLILNKICKDKNHKFLSRKYCSENLQAQINKRKNIYKDFRKSFGREKKTIIKINQVLRIHMTEDKNQLNQQK